MKRHRRLGSPPDVHEYQARYGIVNAAFALDDVNRAALKKDCQGVWDSLLIVRANLSHAYAHLSSYRATKAVENKFYSLQDRFERLRETIGFQCTRRIK